MRSAPPADVAVGRYGIPLFFRWINAAFTPGWLVLAPLSGEWWGLRPPRWYTWRDLAEIPDRGPFVETVDVILTSGKTVKLRQVGRAKLPAVRALWLAARNGPAR
jgi:hypothetical protein